MTPSQRCAALALALQRYREKVCDEYDETLHDVIGRVAAAGSLGKTDLGALLLWKRIRVGAWAEQLLCKSDEDVRKITAKAVSVARDQELTVPETARMARQTLLDLPGAKVGDAFASVVIVVAAPDRMAVYDYHTHLGLWRLGFRLEEKSGLYFRYMELVEQCRTELLKQGHGRWLAREVDLALLTRGA